MKTQAALLALLATLLFNGTVYPSTAIVRVVNRTEDKVVVENANGFEYEFDGAEDILVGDVMSLVMFNNSTPQDVKDDVVLFARYSGYVSKDFAE